ncbi:hypothetical protein [Fictibacillus barbaricus]|uniref:Oligosaccharide repeat unit polymerase n=1 Tax=Fictibacillus barbaricus TaxID=182136 RepID=A0ABS2ZJ65_9BACL|nr:hypothetical protein [Fictibacillus barbaricus]MBN3546740.1 hypothetical protein [Fictibacillus barbaricus]GGB43486.1 hypothetical protein GCM10007199_05990 [Fictibacillus barbaricus]
MFLYVITPWILFFIFAYIAYKKDLLKSFSGAFYVTVTFMILPAGLFYAFGGERYYVPNEESIKWFSIYMSILYVSMIAGLFVQQKVKNLFLNREYKLSEGFQNYTYIKWVSVIVFSACFIYVIAFAEKIPLIQLVIGKTLQTSFSRPDVAGGIPFFYTFTIVANTVIPFFLILMLRKENFFKHNNRILLVVFTTMAVIFTSVALNKNTLFLIIIFFILYVIKSQKRFIYLFSAGFVFVIYYFATKVFFNAGENPYSAFTFVESILKRIFVTQGAGLTTRIEFEDKPLPDDISIKRYIFEIMYGKEGGSAPTIFFGDNIMTDSLLVTASLIVVATLFFFALAGMTDGLYQKSGKVEFLALGYVVFYGGHLLGISEIQSFGLRTLLPIALIAGLYLTDKLVDRTQLFNKN